MAARRRDALEAAARQCRTLGARSALAIPADAADATQMQALFRHAAALGGIDAWINIAGVAAFGPYERIPIEVQSRLVEVNLIGAMNGAHAACPGCSGATAA